MIIAIDYDDTFTESPDMWCGCIGLMQLYGHCVVCVCGRRETFDNRRELENNLPENVEVYFSYDEPKRDYMMRVQKMLIDVWIDDKPMSVDQSR